MQIVNDNSNKFIEIIAGGIDIFGAIPEDAIGRIAVKDTGYIDVKDKTTYEIAKAYLKMFAEKLGITEEEG